MSTVESFNPKRLSLARDRRGLTKKRLAELVGVDVRSITGYERGEYPPEPERLRILATTLRFPSSFFFLDDCDVIEPDIVSFRSMSKMKAGMPIVAVTRPA